MKKLNFVFIKLLLLMFITTGSFAGIHNGKDSLSRTKCIKKNDCVITVFYGTYNYNSLLYDQEQGHMRSFIASLQNYGQFGGNIEIMSTDKIGVGIEYTQGLATFSYEPSGAGTIATGELTKQRFLVKMNFHSYTGKNLDFYNTFGIGFNIVNAVNSNGNTIPNVNYYNIPIAFRIGVGIRYFFIPNFGINAEVGLGGPTVQGGLF